MSKLSEKERVLIKNRILNVILNNPKMYTKKQLGDMFQVSDRTIENYIREYNENGYRILTVAGKVAINNSPNNITLQYIRSGKEDIKKVIILSLINSESSRGFTTDELAKYIIDNRVLSTENNKYVRKLISKLEQDKYIYKENKIIKSYRYPYEIFLEDKYEETLIFFSLIKDQVENSIAANRIYNKLTWCCDNYNKEAIVKINSSSLRSMDEGIISKIEESLVTSKYLQLKYLSKEKLINYKVIVRHMVYSKEKEMWYLICLEEIRSALREIVLRTDKIISISLMEEYKEGYEISDSSVYKNSINISSESPCEIKVKFAKKKFIYEKIKKYVNEREYASLEEIEDGYILQDIVNGIQEVKGWISSFGRGAKIIEPKELQQKILNDIKVLKERYGVDG